MAAKKKSDPTPHFILPHLHKALQDSESVQRQSGTTNYPSSASIVHEKKGVRLVTGACLRAEYWRRTHEPKTNPPDAQGYLKMLIGKVVEEALVNLIKEKGMWRGNNIKFFEPEVEASGEADVFFWLDRLNGLEIKTGYGYYFSKSVLDAKTGMPKDDHLLQTFFYLKQAWNFDGEQVTLPCWNILYMDRGDGADKEFYIFSRDGNDLWIGSQHQKPVKHPYITWEGIKKRMEESDAFVNTGMLPPNDYVLKFTPARAKQLFDLGEMSKTAYKKFVDNKPGIKGDWRCAYCNWKDTCLKVGQEKT